MRPIASFSRPWTIQRIQLGYRRTHAGQWAWSFELPVGTESQLMVAHSSYSGRWHTFSFEVTRVLYASMHRHDSGTTVSAPGGKLT